MKRLLSFVLLTLCLYGLHGLQGLRAQNSAQLRIWLDPLTESVLGESGIAFDHGTYKQGVYFISDFLPEERQWLDNHGIRYDVLIDDVESYYVQRNAMAAVDRELRSSCFASGSDTVAVPASFNLGSMGGFYTYEEFLSELDDMASAYPNLITTRAAIDTFQTHEGRPVYWLLISDNATAEAGEEEVLYTAIHHAREPASLSQLIFYMWYLLERYGTDDEITQLVDNRALYFIPMLNPDGYAYNQSTNPNGGGLWRKNRRDNGNGTFGVDLNRNYGFEWGYDENGSSSSPSDQEYRGPAPFSEPETRAVKWFCEQHDFALALNYHSWGDFLIYPWGYIPAPLTPDSNTFRGFAREMTAENGYTYGTGYETVAHATNGDSDDWMYGEQSTKNKIFSMTPEVGEADDSFWPQSNRIIPLSQENVLPNMLLAHFAGDYLQAVDEMPTIITATAGSLDVGITRLGLAFNGPYEVKLVSHSPKLTITDGPATVSNIGLNEYLSLSFNYILSSAIAQGEAIEYDIVTTVNGLSRVQRLSKIYGQPTIALNESGDALGDFIVQGWYTTTETYVSPATSITDSPDADYGNNTSSTLHYQRVIDLRDAVYGELSFQSKWDLEAGYDYVQLLGSPIGMDQWTPLCGRFSTQGTEYQDEGQPVWDGTQADWVQERVDLSAYLGQRIEVKWEFRSDPFVTGDGYYLDDLAFQVIRTANPATELDTGYVLDALSADQSVGQASWLNVYPNPASDRVVVQHLGHAPSTIEVYSLDGRLVHRESFVGTTVLQTALWSEGLYLLHVHSAQGFEVRRLIVGAD